MGPYMTGALYNCMGLTPRRRLCSKALQVQAQKEAHTSHLTTQSVLSCLSCFSGWQVPPSSPLSMVSPSLPWVSIPATGYAICSLPQDTITPYLADGNSPFRIPALSFHIILPTSPAVREGMWVCFFKI